MEMVRRTKTFVYLHLTEYCRLELQLVGSGLAEIK